MMQQTLGPLARLLPYYPAGRSCCWSWTLHFQPLPARPSATGCNYNNSSYFSSYLSFVKFGKKERKKKKTSALEPISHPYIIGRVCVCVGQKGIKMEWCYERSMTWKRMGVLLFISRKNYYFDFIFRKSISHFSLLFSLTRTFNIPVERKSKASVEEKNKRTGSGEIPKCYSVGRVVVSILLRPQQQQQDKREKETDVL